MESVRNFFFGLVYLVLAVAIPVLIVGTGFAYFLKFWVSQ